MRTLLWKEMLEQWRSQRLLIVAAVLAAFGLLGPLSARYMPELLGSMPGVPEGLAEILPTPDAAMAVGEYLDNVVQFGVVLALLVPMGAVASEKASGTAGLTLSKPVSRAAFLAAKLAAHAITFAIGVLAAALAGYYYTGVLSTWLPAADFAALNLLVWLYLMVWVSITLMTSTLGRSQLAAAGGAFGILLVLGVLGGWPPLAPWLPGALIGWARALGMGVPVDPAWRAVALSAAVAAGAQLIAWASLRRQEL